MNRSLGLIGILLTIFVLILLSLSIVVTSTRADQGNLLVPKIDVEATAQAIQFENKRAEIESIAQRRLATVQAQIAQRQQTLVVLNRSNKAETIQLQTQLSNLKTQIEQSKTEIQQLQTTITQLEQDIKEDQAAYQKELADEQFEMEQKETLLQEDLQNVSDQLQVVHDEIAKWTSLSPSPALENNDTENTGGEPYQNDDGDEHDNRDSDEAGDEHKDEHKDEGVDEDEGKDHASEDDD